MNFQHVENLLIRVRGQGIKIKTISGSLYEGTITDVTNDYVALKCSSNGSEGEQIIILLDSIECVILGT
jgi:ferredoxin-fold anticodon binding domain-containing protein